MGKIRGLENWQFMKVTSCNNFIVVMLVSVGIFILCLGG